MFLQCQRQQRSPFSYLGPRDILSRDQQDSALNRARPTSRKCRCRAHESHKPCTEAPTPPPTTSRRPRPLLPVTCVSSPSRPHTATLYTASKCAHPPAQQMPARSSIPAPTFDTLNLCPRISHRLGHARPTSALKASQPPQGLRAERTPAPPPPSRCRHLLPRQPCVPKFNNRRENP